MAPLGRPARLARPPACSPAEPRSGKEGGGIKRREGTSGATEAVAPGRPAFPARREKRRESRGGVVGGSDRGGEGNEASPAMRTVACRSDESAPGNPLN